MIKTYEGAVLRDVGGIEITKTSENPRFAIPLSRGKTLAESAKDLAKRELETQRFINAVFAANQFPSMPMVHIF